MQKLSDFLNKIVSRLLVMFFMIMTVILNIQVFARYIMNSSLSWSEESARFLFVWIVAIGASIGVKEKFHVVVSILTDRLPKSVQTAVRFAVSMLMAVIACVLLYSGSLLLRSVSVQVSASLNLPMPVLYACIPISAFLMLIHIIADMKTNIKTTEGK